MLNNRDKISETSLTDAARVAHCWVLAITSLFLGAELFLLAWDERWIHMFIVVLILSVILLPILAKQRMPVMLPSEMQVLAILFIVATIYLGEVKYFYERFWWWDLALHATAGLLFGLAGFMIVYLLNESQIIEISMRPSFVALFAFFFSLGIGVIWEIFEFAMDSLFGMTMQKPMAGDPSELTDTMWDLIVNALGALVVSMAGWMNMRKQRRHWVDGWAQRLIETNPGLFIRRSDT